MPNKSEYNLEFRPESYWDQATGFTNIKGEVRRRVIEIAFAEGEIDILPPFIFSDEIPDEERAKASRFHPMFMGGEYLPGYRDTELEIARVSLESIMWDVMSVRAWMEEDGLIHYQIADEYMEDGKSRYIFEPKTSELPLTLGELITMIDTADLTEEHNIGYTGLTSWREKNYDAIGPGKEELDSLADFVKVSSDFYPYLGLWYLDEAFEWYMACIRELKGDE